MLGFDIVTIDSGATVNLNGKLWTAYLDVKGVFDLNNNTSNSVFLRTGSQADSPARNLLRRRHDLA